MKIKKKIWLFKKGSDLGFKTSALLFALSNQDAVGDGMAFRVCTAPCFLPQSKWLVSCAQKGLEKIFL